MSSPNTSSGATELGVYGTVFMDREMESPMVIYHDLPFVDADEYLAENGAPGLLANIQIVSVYSLHVALYALQNPTPENIKRALFKIGTSGDAEALWDHETMLPLPVIEPSGWNEHNPEGF